MVGRKMGHSPARVRTNGHPETSPTALATLLATLGATRNTGPPRRWSTADGDRGHHDGRRSNRIPMQLLVCSEARVLPVVVVAIMIVLVPLVAAASTGKVAHKVTTGNSHQGGDRAAALRQSDFPLYSDRGQVRALLDSGDDDNLNRNSAASGKDSDKETLSLEDLEFELVTLELLLPADASGSATSSATDLGVSTDASQKRLQGGSHDDSDPMYVVVAPARSGTGCEVRLSSSARDENDNLINEFMLRPDEHHSGTYSLQSTAPCPYLAESGAVDGGLRQCISLWGASIYQGAQPLKLGGCGAVFVDAPLYLKHTDSALYVDNKREAKDSVTVSASVGVWDSYGKVPSEKDSFWPWSAWRHNESIWAHPPQRDPDVASTAASNVWRLKQAPKAKGVLLALQVTASVAIGIATLAIALGLGAVLFLGSDIADHPKLAQAAGIEDDARPQGQGGSATQTKQTQRAKQLRALKGVVDAILVLPSSFAATWKTLRGPKGLSHVTLYGRKTRWWGDVLCAGPPSAGAPSYARRALLLLVADSDSEELPDGARVFPHDEGSDDDRYGGYAFNCTGVSDNTDVKCSDFTIGNLGLYTWDRIIQTTAGVVGLVLALALTAIASWRLYCIVSGHKFPYKRPLSFATKGVVLLRVAVAPLVQQAGMLSFVDGPCAVWSHAAAAGGDPAIVAGAPADWHLFPKTDWGLFVAISLLLPLFLALVPPCLCLWPRATIAFFGGSSLIMLMGCVAGVLIGGVLRPQTWHGLFGFHDFTTGSFTIGTVSEYAVALVLVLMPLCSASVKRSKRFGRRRRAEGYIAMKN